MKGIEPATRVREIRKDVQVTICSGREEAIEEL